MQITFSIFYNYKDLRNLFSFFFFNTIMNKNIFFYKNILKNVKNILYCKNI